MTIKTIEYNSADQNVFAHNTAEIQIDGNGATLLKRSLESDEKYLATGRIQQDADLGAYLPVFPRRNAVWDSVNSIYDISPNETGNYVSLNDDSARDGATQLPDTSHFNMGHITTIRFKITFPYSGSPATSSYIFTTADSTVSNGLGAMITMYHHGAGSLYISTRDHNGSATVTSTFGAFSPVAGQEYEFEVHIDNNSSFRDTIVWVDGIQQGAIGSAASISSGVTITRDFFYFGTYYTDGASWVGRCSVRDIQIFNTKKHSSNFASEVPRVVGVYPDASMIEPSEHSVAEGFTSISDVTEEYLNHIEEPITKGAEVKYVLHVENVLYYISGGILTPYIKYNADESLRSPLNQCNTAAEWIANEALVDAIIGVGARITFQPVIISGVDRVGNIKLLSSTLNYDFFALPVTCTECTLYGFVKDNCDDITSGTVRVYTKKPVLTQGNLVSIDNTVDIELPNGFFEIPLVIPDGGDAYKLEINWVDADGVAWSYKKNILIPNQISVLLPDAVLQ